MDSSRIKTREPVVQEDKLGCAVASTAFVLETPYREALNLFEDGTRRVRGEANFYCPEIVKILNQHGLNYSWVKLDESNKQVADKDLSIVFVDRSPQLPFGHFLVRSKDKWMDPWINLPNPERLAGFREELPGTPTYAVFPNK